VIKRCLLLSGLAMASLALAGCISPRSFVDPSFPKVSYEDPKKRNEPLRLKLVVVFQRNGVPFPRADSTLRDHAERILRSTGLIMPSSDPGEGEINLVVNNVADLGSAAAKGFGTGLTLGLVGTTVMDAYEMSISITANGKTVSRTAIKHALHTAIGNTSLPEGLEGVSPETAFARVLEQMLLRALQDMQKSGDLAALKAFPLMFAAPSAGAIGRQYSVSR
jgi:hypothetical protein